jgi:hypothetical protein
LAEDSNELVSKVCYKAKTMDAKKLKKSLLAYGSIKAKRLLEPLIST